MNKKDKENSSHPLPRVSIVIPMYNEIGAIDKCIESILQQDYPGDRIEVLVVDGFSTDGCREVVQAMAQKFPQVQLLDNPDRITPKGLNIGIKKSRGDVVIILGAHTRIKSDFVRQNIACMQRVKVKCVGGTQINVGDSYFQQAVGYVMGSPFGMPSAPYRFGNAEKYVDTVVYAAYDKSLFREVGYFDEELFISEDAEFNWRIRKAGHKIFFSPQIISYYYPRKTWKRLIHQLFRYGTLRVNVIKKHVDAIKLIHLLPAFMVLVALALFILGFFQPIFFKILIALAAFYIVYVLMASLLLSFSKGLKFIFLLPVIFLSIQLSWGLGFLVGFFKTRYKKNR